MPNVFERFFLEAKQRIPDFERFNEQHSQDLDSQEQSVFDPMRSATEKDNILTVEENREFNEIQKRFPDYRKTSSLTGEDRSGLDRAVRKVGFDVLAFYKSRRYLEHRPYRGMWGIFYLSQGLERVAERIGEYYPGYGCPELLAYQFIRAHESFHFQFDVYALASESQLRQNLYGKLKHAVKTHQVDNLEEALANRQAWDWARQKQIGIGEFAFQFMKEQPGTYARFDESRLELSSKIAANLLDSNFSWNARRNDQEVWVATIPKELLRRSLLPEYVVKPRSFANWINPTTSKN